MVIKTTTYEGGAVVREIVDFPESLFDFPMKPAEATQQTEFIYEE